MQYPGLVLALASFRACARPISHHRPRVCACASSHQVRRLAELAGWQSGTRPGALGEELASGTACFGWILERKVHCVELRGVSSGGLDRAICHCHDKSPTLDTHRRSVAAFLHSLSAAPVPFPFLPFSVQRVSLQTSHNQQTYILAMPNTIPPAYPLPGTLGPPSQIPPFRTPPAARPPSNWQATQATQALGRELGTIRENGVSVYPGDEHQVTTVFGPGTESIELTRLFRGSSPR